MSLVFINYPLETFTPTSSGALATIIWECCRVAERQGKQPHVITRRSADGAFPWKNLHCIDYPAVPDNRILLKLVRAERKLTGWRHLRHRVYTLRVAQTIRQADLSHLPLVLINDPEMTVYLRKRFPKAAILHWFENQQTCSASFRERFRTAANAVCGVSDFTSRWISEYYDVPDVKTLYNGVDSAQFAPSDAETRRVPVLNFVGRTGIEKAPDLLLGAALRLSERTREFALQIIGSNHWDRFEMDAYQCRLQEMADRLTQQGIAIRRPGHIGRSELPEEFRKADVHVVPSRWDEPFGLTTIEGMASGLAVVASDTGGTPEVVGDAGILFQRDSEEGLAEALLPLISDPKLRREHARKARERAEEFPWERTWNTLERYVRT